MALADPKAFRTSLPFSLRPLRPKLHRSLPIRPNPRPIVGRCLSVFGLYGPGYSAASAWADLIDLVVSLFIRLRPLRLQLNLSCWLWPTPRPLCPYDLSAFGLYSNRCITASNVGGLPSRCVPDACQPSAYTAQAAMVPWLRLTPWLLSPRRPLAYTFPSYIASFGFGRDHGHYDITAYQPWPYTVLSATQLLA